MAWIDIAPASAMTHPRAARLPGSGRPPRRPRPSPRRLAGRVLRPTVLSGSGAGLFHSRLRILRSLSDGGPAQPARTAGSSPKGHTGHRPTGPDPALLGHGDRPAPAGRRRPAVWRRRRSAARGRGDPRGLGPRRLWDSGLYWSSATWFPLFFAEKSGCPRTRRQSGGGELDLRDVTGTLSQPTLVLGRATVRRGGWADDH